MLNLSSKSNRVYQIDITAFFVSPQSLLTLIVVERAMMTIAAPLETEIGVFVHFVVDLGERSERCICVYES